MSILLLFLTKLSSAMIFMSLGQLCRNHYRSNTFCIGQGADAFLSSSSPTFDNNKRTLMSSKTEFSSGGSFWIYSSTRSLSGTKGRSTTNNRRKGAYTALKMWGESPQQGGASFPINNQEYATYQSNPRQRINKKYNNQNMEDEKGSSSGVGGGGGWDDFDVRSPRQYVEKYDKGSKNNRNTIYDRKSWATKNNKKVPSQIRRRYQDDDYVGAGKKQNINKDDNEEDLTKEKKINMRALEMAGFVHLYGISPVLNALAANRRFDMLIRDDDVVNERLKELTNGEEEQTTHTNSIVERKPEAQFAPWLFIQEQQGSKTTGSSSTKRNASKVKATQEIVALAKKRGIPIAYVDKGVLNSLVSGFGSSTTSSPRPHQGFVLRCGSLNFVNYDIMDQTNHFCIDSTANDAIDLWIALDEVVDPQNLGALLRSIYFFSNTNNAKKVGVLVCAKNSAPLSPAVSAASAGALELMTVYSTNNLPKSLAKANQKGWRVLGAAAAVGTVNNDEGPEEETVECLDLMEINPSSQPTILVLGNEGSGLRTLVSKCCTGFVRIPGGNKQYYSDEDEVSSGNSIGVDSLNVSVTGGILLWHFMHSQ